MLLTTLAEEVTAFLNNDVSIWTPETITVKTELDPYLCLLSELGVYIVPGFIQLNIAASGTRPRSRPPPQSNRSLFFNLIVSEVFDDLPTGDGVANWGEAKAIVDTRQRAEERLMQFKSSSSSSLTLVSVEPQPIDEAELEVRNFIAMTTFGYEETVCITEHELP